MQRLPITNVLLVNVEHATMAQAIMARGTVATANGLPRSLGFAGRRSLISLDVADVAISLISLISLVGRLSATPRDPANPAGKPVHEQVCDRCALRSTAEPAPPNCCPAADSEIPGLPCADPGKTIAGMSAYLQLLSDAQARCLAWPLEDWFVRQDAFHAVAPCSVSHGLGLPPARGLGCVEPALASRISLLLVACGCDSASLSLTLSEPSVLLASHGRSGGCQCHGATADRALLFVSQPAYRI